MPPQGHRSGATQAQGSELEGAGSGPDVWDGGPVSLSKSQAACVNVLGQMTSAMRQFMLLCDEVGDEAFSPALVHQVTLHYGEPGLFLSFTPATCHHC